MENSEVQLSLEEQLEKLKKEQEEAKRICDKRIEMGMLYHDSASVQDLAAEILDRKIRIQELEEQIAQKSDTRSAKEEKDAEKALAEYKPKMNIFQWIRSKFNKIKERVENSRKARMNNAKFEVDSPENRYQEIVDNFNNNAHQNAQEPKPWDLNPKEQEIVEEGYEKIRTANNQDGQSLEPDELSQETLDKVISYEDGIVARYDFPMKKTNSTDKFIGR